MDIPPQGKVGKQHLGSELRGPAPPEVTASDVVVSAICLSPKMESAPKQLLATTDIPPSTDYSLQAVGYSVHVDSLPAGMKELRKEGNNKRQTTESMFRRGRCSGNAFKVIAHLE